MLEAVDNFSFVRIEMQVGGSPPPLIFPIKKSRGNSGYLVLPWQVRNKPRLRGM